MSVCRVEHMQIYTVTTVGLHGVRCVMISGTSTPKGGIIKQEYVHAEVFLIFYHSSVIIIV